MRKTVKLLVCINTIFAFLVLAGCQKENENGDNNNSGEDYFDEPTIVSTQEINNNGSVIVEALFNDGSKMYFKLLSSNTAEVCNWKSFYNSESNEGYVYRGDVVVPTKIAYSNSFYSIIGIQNEAFQSCSLLSSIRIPNSVTYIGAKAFRNCYSLISVSIPNSIISIQDFTFENCTKLSSILLPNSVLFLGKGAFVNCSSLTSIVLPNSIKEISSGDYNPRIPGVFENCTNLSSIIIGDSVTSIGERTFYNCSSLNNVTIGKSVKNIGNGAFFNCTNLISIKIPNSTIAIGSQLNDLRDYGAFERCVQLSSIEFGDAIKTIGDKAFYDCSALISIHLPSNLDNLGYYAFSYTGLENITIPGFITRMHSCFYGCTSLSSVTCFANTPPYSNNSFKQCPLSVICVPIESVDLYKNADDWKDYVDIIVGV